ncbi:tRNA (adenosine(37)-N6)-dimethylallyltransferase MiaA [Novosphingobium aquae]
MTRAMSNVDSPERPPLALIAGPTASGKSDLAVRLAKALEAQGRRGVVINADSAQVYADLEILSARPSVYEMQGVEHRLFGEWDGAQACSAADWAERARAEIALAHEHGSVPILVGGTGLYVRTLLDGIAPIPAIDPQVREAVRDMPLGEAALALQAEDPQRAARLGPTDSARIRRALEVVRSSGQSLSHWQQQVSGGIGDSVTLHAAILLPDRAWLYGRCDRRFATMLQRGAIDEVVALLARQLSPDLPVMRAIGVPEIVDFLRGTTTLEDVLARGSQSTRNYVKRQITWLRHQPPTDWPRFELEHFNEGDIFASLLRD